MIILKNLVGRDTLKEFLEVLVPQNDVNNAFRQLIDSSTDQDIAQPERVQSTQYHLHTCRGFLYLHSLPVRQEFQCEVFRCKVYTLPPYELSLLLW